MSADLDLAYQCYIDSRIAEEAQRTDSLTELTATLPGVYPTDVLGRLDSLVRAGTVTADRARVLRTYRRVSSDLEAARSVLPTAHPLDYEWRFTADSCERLLHDHIGTGACVVGLGTPRLAEFAGGESMAFTLVERRASACEALAAMTSLDIVHADLANEDLHRIAGTCDAVVADPPWYRPITELFIARASTLLRSGGHLIVCVPGLGTRPQVPEERVEVIEFASNLGLALAELHRHAIGYEAPPFELAALEAAGLPDFDPQWRHADLLVFHKTESHRVPRFAPNHDETGPWLEFVRGPARIRVRVGTAGSGAALVAPAVNGAVLDSVSIRDPRRTTVDVWTTTNRVYTSAEPDALARLLASSDTEPPDPLVEALWFTEFEALARYGFSTGLNAEPCES